MSESERAPYVIEERAVTLVLDETTAFPGAEIDVSLSVDWTTYMDIRRWLHEFAELEAESPDLDEVDKAFRAAASLFEPYLIGWNLTNHRGPIPATAEGLLRLPDPRLMAVILTTWVSQIAMVARPLGNGSTDGTDPSSTPTPDSGRTTRQQRRSASRQS